MVTNSRSLRHLQRRQRLLKNILGFPNHSPAPLAIQIVETEDQITIEAMAVTEIKIGEEAGTLAHRSRLQATAIQIGVQTTNTPHRPLLVTIFRQIMTE